MPVKIRSLSVNTNWIDVSEPSQEELKQVAHDYDLNRYQVKNCMNADHLPSSESIGNAQFLMTRFFSALPAQHLHSLQELTSKIAIFYNEQFVVTIHAADVSFLDKEIAGACLNDEENKTPANIVGLVILHVLKTYEATALKLSEQIDDYEQTIVLKTLKTPMLKGLYYMKRKAGIGKRLLIMTGEIIRYVENLEIADNTKRDIDDLNLKLNNWFEQIIDDINNLLNTFISLSAHKTNDVMKTLTILSVFFLPLTFIVGIYGMNFRDMPELHWRHGYISIWIIMVAVTVFIYLWFKKKRWF